MPVSQGNYFYYAHKEGLLGANNSNIVSPYLTNGPSFLHAHSDLHSILQHVGIRGALNDWKDYDDDYEVGFIISHADELEDIGWKGVVQKIRETVGNNPVYSKCSSYP